jgi:ketosteroid isomerase-like protein
VREAYAVAYVRRSVDEMRDRFAPDFEWHQRAEWPGRAVYRVDELPSLWAELDETYGEFELEPVDFVDADSCVIVEVHTSARMRATDDRVEGVIWHVWHLADGVVTGVRVFTERSEAFAAAGGV